MELSLTLRVCKDGEVRLQWRRQSCEVTPGVLLRTGPETLEPNLLYPFLSPRISVLTQGN